MAISAPLPVLLSVVNSISGPLHQLTSVTFICLPLRSISKLKARWWLVRSILPLTAPQKTTHRNLTTSRCLYPQLVINTLSWLATIIPIKVALCVFKPTAAARAILAWCYGITVSKAPMSDGPISFQNETISWTSQGTRRAPLIYSTILLCSNGGFDYLGTLHIHILVQFSKIYRCILTNCPILYR